jgi:hypothetical protein
MCTKFPDYRVYSCLENVTQHDTINIADKGLTTSPYGRKFCIKIKLRFPQVPYMLTPN